MHVMLISGSAAVSARMATRVGQGSFWVYAYFVSFILLCDMVLLNLITAIIIASLDKINERSARVPCEYLIIARRVMFPRCAHSLHFANRSHRHSCSLPLRARTPAHRMYGTRVHIRNRRTCSAHTMPKHPRTLRLAYTWARSASRLTRRSVS